MASGMVRGARRVLGALLVVLVLLPLYRLLPLRETGGAGVTTFMLSRLHLSLLMSGTAVLAIPTILAARLFRPRHVDPPVRRAGRWLATLPAGMYAAILAVMSGMLTVLFGLEVLDGKANLIDAMSQLVHARYLAAGKLAGPVSPFWHIQNTLVTPHGWVSQYPPGHVLLLALGFRLGAVWLVGPAMVALTVFFTTLAADRLLRPDDRPVARLGALLVALNPFLIGLAGAYMNHVTAAAFGSIAVYCAVRARDGRWGWAVAAGAAVGAVLVTRPLAAVVLATVVAATFLIGDRRDAVGRGRRWTARVAGAAVGGVPFFLAIAAYNAHFFGDPLRFGYQVAHGPTTRLGFHRDPWGNVYGPVEALIYTSTDLQALSLHLLETPVPAVLVIGAFLLFARRLRAGERILVLWALLPVLANALYWHHGLFMGPRMLNEWAPAWALLLAVAAVRLAQSVPPDRLLARGYSPRVALVVLFLCAWVAGVAYLGPERLLSYGRDWMRTTRIEPPATEEPTLVFVHGSWQERVGMALAASGMHLDSLETVMRQNSTCEFHAFADAYLHQPRTALPALDFQPRSRVPGIMKLENAPGNAVKIRRGEMLTEACLRQMDADRNGRLPLAPFLWQRDLPGLATTGALLVRDRGPEENARLIRAFPDRRPLVFYTPAPGAAPVLVPYREGMERIWGRDAVPPGPSAR